MTVDTNALNVSVSETQESEPTGFRKWLPLIVLSLALMIIILDTTILNVSLRTIIDDLHTNIQSIQWVITAYSLMLAAFTITGGRLGDLFGRKKMFVLGAIIFAAGSFMTSIAHSVSFMIWGEAIIEGIGAAIMLPATSSLLVSNYKGRDRQIGFGIWGAIAAAAAALGPLFGGWLTTNYSWRWAFRINVFVALALVLGAFLIKESLDMEEKPSLDVVGMILSALGLLSIAFGFIESTDYGWIRAKQQLVLFHHTLNLGTLSVVPLFILLGIIILGIFAVWQDHRTKTGKTPLVSLKLFRNAQFTIGASMMALLALGQTGLSFATPVFLQSVLHLSALRTGIVMLPMSLALLVASPLSAYVSKYIKPKRLIQLGLVLNVIGFWVLRSNISTTGGQWALTPGYIIFGAGFGLMISQVSNVTLSAVSVQESGEASGVNSTMRQVGATLGAAILGAILISTLATHMVSGVNSSSVIPTELKPQIATAVSAQVSNIEFGSGAAGTSSLPQSISDEITKISKEATVQASHTTLAVGAIFGILGLLVSFWLPESKDLEVAQSVAANAPEDKLVPVAQMRKRAAVMAIVIIAGAGTGGYFIGKHDTSPSSVTNASGQSAVISPTPTPTVPVTVPPTPPTPVTPPQNYTNNPLHFAMQMPTNWQVANASSNEVKITTDSNVVYSVQVYASTSSNMNDLKNFLAEQRGISNIQNSTLAAMPVLSFDLAGTYVHGIAFLSGGRLYYILGPNVQSNFGTFTPTN